MSEQQPQYLDYLLKFHIEKFHGNGTQDARRWLIDLKAEFRDRNLKIPVVPSLWVEAILRGKDEEAARWMDSTTHIRRIIDNYEQATAADSTFLEQSFKERFPMVARSQSSKTTREMLAESSQLKSEPFPDYYKRATEFILLLNISDRGNSPSHVILSEAEEMILEMLIEAFVAGLEDEELRLNSISRGATTSKSSLETYAIVKAEAVDEIYRAPQLANSVVARFSDRPPYSQGSHNRFPKTLDRLHHQYNNNNYQQIFPPQGSHNPRPSHISNPSPAGPSGYQGPPPPQPRSNNQQSGNRGASRNHPGASPQRQIAPNRNSSRNPVVNGSKNFTTECIKCGQLGHCSRSCRNPALQPWEQDVLKQLAFPHEAHTASLTVQTIHDLEYNRSCDYFFAGLLPEESQSAKIPTWPVPLGWKSKSWTRLEQTSHSTPARNNFRSPTAVNSGLNCQPHLDPPVCDIDDFVDQVYDEDRHVGFQTNAVELLVPYVPLQDFLTFEVNSSSHLPNKGSNLAELQHEARLLEANLAETRKRQRIDMGDGERYFGG
ncbi:hypothetical protein K3495_g4173 [Podosphaera aphanis]|nr:hypothetical protein K3495_g4173 [Podosphaera aphanis]